MPTYKYRREDGTTFTIRQRITADALETCPDTGQKVERVITGGSGFHLKGGGWYKDGYSSVDSGASKAGDNGAANGTDSKSSDKKESSSETKSSDASKKKESKKESA